MATITRTKKILLAGVFALSAAFVLSACDPVTAVPANYESPIVLKDGSAFDDKDNKLGALYDALAGNKNEKVVSALLEKIAEKEFGTYAELKACFNADGTVKEAEAKAHIAAHAHQFVSDDDATLKEGVSAEELQLKRFAFFFEDLNERIDKKVFAEVSTETYRDKTNKTEFDEEKYARAKRKENYDIKHFLDNGEVEVGFHFKKVFLDSNFKEENVRDYLSNFEDTYGDYITKSIIPDVYKDKLIEEYVLDNNYSALGRAYGREVNYVKIPYSSDDPNTAWRLVNKFAKDYLDKAARVGTEVEYDQLVSWIKGFEGMITDNGGNPVISNLVNTGLDDIYGAARAFKLKCEASPISAADQKTALLPLFEEGGILSGAPGTTPSDKYDDFVFYEKTKLGEILKDYEKAVVGELTRFSTDDDKKKYEEFTTNGSKEQGLVEKITNAALENDGKMTDSGWFVKNDKEGGLNVSEEIKNRLFNIKVSNDFDKDTWVYEKGESYFNKLQGHTYLTPAAATDAEYDFIIRDTSGNALYIVEILEAPSTSKLNKDKNNAKSYVNSGDAFKCERIAREIAKILGTKDTYTTNAYTSYLKLYTFTFHDTSVYDYIKDTYPNLFEDE